MYIKDVDLTVDANTEQALQNLIKGIPADIKKSPLNVVKITIGGEELKGAFRIGEFRDESDFIITSNDSGEFEGSWIVNKSGTQIDVKASKNGYINAVGRTEHYSSHAIVVILVKDENRE